MYQSMREALVMQSADSDWLLRGDWRLMTCLTQLMNGKEINIRALISWMINWLQHCRPASFVIMTCPFSSLVVHQPHSYRVAQQTHVNNNGCVDKCCEMRCQPISCLSLLAVKTQCVTLETKSCQPDRQTHCTGSVYKNNLHLTI